MPAENAGPDLREAFLYSSARHRVTRLVFDRNSRVNVEVHGAIQRFQLLSFAPVLRRPYDDGRSPPSLPCNEKRCTLQIGNAVH